MCFFKIDKTCKEILAILPRFLEDLLCLQIAVNILSKNFYEVEFYRRCCDATLRVLGAIAKL